MLPAQPTGPVPEETARIAHQVFPKGNRYLKLRDELGSIYCDRDFADLQHLLTAAAINVVRIVNWLNDIPHAKTRTSRFAALNPAVQAS